MIWIQNNTTKNVLFCEPASQRTILECYANYDVHEPKYDIHEQRYDFYEPKYDIHEPKCDVYEPKLYSHYIIHNGFIYLYLFIS